mgnify:CR=1 FL=1
MTLDLQIGQVVIYTLDKIMEEEWNHMQYNLQEGIRDWISSRWRSVKEAISKMVNAIKDAYQKYVQAVVEKFIQTIKDVASKGIQELFNFLGIELSADVSFGKMK